MNGIKILSADAECAPAMSRVMKKSWLFAYESIIDKDYLNNISDDNWTLFLTDGMKNGDMDCYIAEAGGKIIAAAVIKKSKLDGFQDDGEIVALYALPEYIGCGAGKKLLFHAENALKRKNFDHCILAVLRGNTRAKDFYLHEGYSVTAKTVSARLGNDDLICEILRKEL